MPIAQIFSVLGCDDAATRQSLEALKESLNNDNRGICVTWAPNLSAAGLAVKIAYAAQLKSIYLTDVTRSISIIDEYLSAQKQRNRRPLTLKSYRQFFIRFAKEISGSITEVTTKDVRQFLMKEESQGNANTTIASKIYKLSSFYKWLEREGMWNITTVK